MEFKKANQHRKQPTLNVPRRGGPLPVVSRVTQPSPRVQKTPTVASAPKLKEPVTQEPQRPQPVHIAPKVTPSSQPTHSGLVKRSNVMKWGIIAVVGVLVVGAVFHQSTAKSDGPQKIVTNPGYQTVLPQGVPINKLGGWKRISPPDKDPVFAYGDSIDGVAVSVSEQQLPQSFSGNADEHVADIAKNFNAATKINTNGATVYLGTSAKGPQSALLTKKNLLILIKSQQKIDNASWQKYADSLQ